MLVRFGTLFSTDGPPAGTLPPTLVINYTDTDPVLMTIQPVEAGDTVADAFPPGVEASSNFQSSAGGIAGVIRQYNLNGAGWVSE
jgi:hypothetical protein